MNNNTLYEWENINDDSLENQQKYEDKFRNEYKKSLIKQGINENLASWMSQCIEREEMPGFNNQIIPTFDENSLKIEAQNRLNHYNNLIKNGNSEESSYNAAISIPRGQIMGNQSKIISDYNELQRKINSGQGIGES